ncbi:MAG: FAD-dependent oxidoreductase [Gammaproteobacteria bacterium]|nr:FAD-dependent oxidoreductase [Gammaproteobacteria bacterium]
MKSHARVAVVGGGVMGVGLLYHLTKEGWSDVVLLDKGELTSGSTWHAAGLIPHFIGSLNMAKVHLYTSQLYQRLEAEVGQTTGWHGCGSIRLATTQDEVDWFHYVQGVLNCVGAECHLISPAEISELHPLLNTEGVLLGAYTPGDGHTDPASSTMAMAAGARQGGADIYVRNRVVDIKRRSNGEWDVITEKGTIVAEHVVNAAGGFAPQIGAMVGLEVPIVNMVHQYLVTEDLDAVKSLEREIPVVRDPRASCYYRQERQGLIIGPYETEGAQPWALDGIDWSFDAELLPPDIERLIPWLESAGRRVPVFENAGIKRVVSGPITHTPDGGFLIGPAPGLANFWMCCGAGIGITQGPGAGKYLAQWMTHGQTEINVREMEARRFGSWSVGNYGIAKAVDEYHQMYQVHYPGEYREAGRPVRTTPIYDKLAHRGAVFAETFGWERPKWFAPPGVEESYGHRRMNYFETVSEECKAVRERVGVIDLSAFSKFDVTGIDAEGFLDRVLANRVPRKGRVTLAHALTDLGGIESEFTVTRFDAHRFYLLSAAVARIHDHDWLMQHRREEEQVDINDVTEDYGTLLVTGPRSRELLAELTDADLSSAAFPWLSGQEIEVAGVRARGIRVSYVGELGWELHHAMSDMETLYGALMKSGERFGIADFGLYAMDALRMEKAYRAWGLELTTELTPIEAGMERFVDFDSPFIGKDVVIERTRNGNTESRLVYLSVDAVDADAHGNEPVYADGRLIGLTTSGAYGHAVERSIAFAFVEPEFAAPNTNLEISILGRRCTAQVVSDPLYDPRNERLRA